MSYTAREEIAQSAHPDCARIAHAARICRRVPVEPPTLIEMRKPSESYAKELLGLDVTVPGSLFGDEHASAEGPHDRAGSVAVS